MEVITKSKYQCFPTRSGEQETKHTDSLTKYTDSKCSFNDNDSVQLQRFDEYPMSMIDFVLFILPLFGFKLFRDFRYRIKCLFHPLIVIIPYFQHRQQQIHCIITRIPFHFHQIRKQSASSWLSVVNESNEDSIESTNRLRSSNINDIHTNYSVNHEINDMSFWLHILSDNTSHGVCSSVFIFWHFVIERYLWSNTDSLFIFFQRDWDSKYQYIPTRFWWNELMFHSVDRYNRFCLDSEELFAWNIERVCSHKLELHDSLQREMHHQNDQRQTRITLEML